MITRRHDFLTPEKIYVQQYQNYNKQNPRE